MDVDDAIWQTIESLPTTNILSTSELLRMPVLDRDRYIEAAAAHAAPLYNADLLLPLAERELTALSSISGKDFLEP